MAYNEKPITTSKYIEDIDSTTGQAVNLGPCIVYSITIISDAGTAGVVTFHDGTSASAAHIFEAKATASVNGHYTFPKGKRFDTGLFVKSNVASLDLAIDYD